MGGGSCAEVELRLKGEGARCVGLEAEARCVGGWRGKAGYVARRGYFVDEAFGGWAAGRQGWCFMAWEVRWRWRVFIWCWRLGTVYVHDEK